MCSRENGGARVAGNVDKEPAADLGHDEVSELELDHSFLREVEIGEFQAEGRDDVGGVACSAGVLEFLGIIEFLDHCGLCD